MTRYKQKKIYYRNVLHLKKMNQKRCIFKCLKWLRALTVTNPRLKERSIKMLNDRYRDYVSFGKVSEFYELGLHCAKDIDTFRKINRQMNNFWAKSVAKVRVLKGIK